MTLQVAVGDAAEARDFYGAFFGREPELEPHEDFLEWRVVPGAEVWFQVVGAADGVRPLTNRVRFAVTDLDAARRGLIRLGRDPSPITTLPGVVRFLDVEDPWGNRLGYYQDIVDAGEATGPGGSVHDEAWFEVDEP